MEGIVIERPGLFDTIQDEGRYGYQAFGMPVSGVMDAYAYKIGNLLLGNSLSAPCIEATLRGPKLSFTQPTFITITGGQFSPQVNGNPVEMWKVLYVKEGDVLDLGAAKKGCRAYLSVKGGFSTSPFLNSSSTYTKAGIGGFEGRTLEKGDRISYPSLEKDVIQHHMRTMLGSAIAHNLRVLQNPDNTLHVILGPQDHFFTRQGIDTFLQKEYSVSMQMDRMGIRLEGPQIEHVDQADILSDSIPFGAIQVPANGQPIILTADRQPTGGYAKIACVIRADFSHLAQLKPGDHVHFKQVTLNDACKRFREQQKQLKTLQLFVTQQLKS